MADAPEEQVGPLNELEVFTLKGEGGRHDTEIKRLEEVLKNLEASVRNTKQQLETYKESKAKVMRMILKHRGKDPGRLPMRELVKPADNSTWIVIGGKSP
jgi:hypothetical protein